MEPVHVQSPPNPSSCRELPPDGLVARADRARRASMAVAEAGEPHTVREGPAGLTWATGLRVLIADDSPVNRLLACAVLSHWGIAPKIAGNGLEAARLACDEAFDLILMDLAMPVMDGFEATRRIRRYELARPLRSPVPVIAYTSDAMPLRGAYLRHSGLNGVLKKPCDSRAMRACLEQWCTGSFAT